MIIRCSMCGRKAESVAKRGRQERPVCHNCAARWATSTRPLPKVGSTMEAVLGIIRVDPGRTKGHAARILAARGEPKRMYSAVDRCIRAGLVEARNGESGYALYLTSLGERVAPRLI